MAIPGCGGGEPLPIGTRGASLAMTAVIVAMLCSACPAQVVHLPIGKNKGAEHKQIEQLESQWREAALAGDTATLSTMLAESYVGIGPDGTIASKTEDLQARTSGLEHFKTLKIEEEKIRIYGTTAVVTSKVHAEGIYAGQAVSGEYRYTRVWNLSHGQWHIVSFEANRAHDASERR
ncbi:nuclear transport factor 2 family protein [Acidipila sp. EB88]|uniref:nuclear transport factor 2 family protein n=1 Tax=Acidipila sp. EB88 TaxID=2305226 RepID=UPI001315840A|nr:nuclear transport factor 2 family protein [Acidipila sp. EB88]